VDKDKRLDLLWARWMQQIDDRNKRRRERERERDNSDGYDRLLDDVLCMEPPFNPPKLNTWTHLDRTALDEWMNGKDPVMDLNWEGDDDA
jgi:hypothetical protein